MRHPTRARVLLRIGLITAPKETKGNTMLSNAYKAVLAFLGLVVTNAVADLMQDGHPFPTNWGDAARWLLTIVVATAGVYGVKPGKGIVTPAARGRHELPE